MSEVYYIGVCTECGSDQPASYMEKSKFQEPSCRYCGGVVRVMRADADKDAFLRSENERRGLFINDDNED